MSIYIDPEHEYHEFYLDSLDASTAINDSVSKLNWPLFNLVVPLQQVISFKILEVQIPLSYSVTAGTSFTVNYYPRYAVGASPGIPVTHTVTLPTTGALTGQQIAAFITTQLANRPKDPANPANPLLGWAHGSNQQTFLVCNFVASSQSATNLPYFEFIVDQHTNNSGNVNQDFDITINNERSQSLLGLPIGTTRCIGFGQDLPTTRKSLVSLRPTLITGPPYIYVTSNTIGNSCKTYLPQGASLLGGGISSPQMAKISISNSVQGQWLIWQDTNPAWFDVDNIATLSQFDLFLQLGNFGGYLDLQGLNFSVKLGVLVKRTVESTTRGIGTYVRTR
ncbi:MAG: hypothetical protein RLZZ86_102 [Cyanobacteriota bacterium]|jgi:hypothetical protein